MAIKHSTSVNPNDIVTSAGWNANHTIEANSINDLHIDWGVGANQVSAIDVPIADGGVIITATEVEGALQENRIAIDLNSLKNTNVTTDLSLGAITATTMVVASSDGTDATLIEADTDDAGLLGADKWDEIVANTADKHTRQHAITTAADHTSAATPNQILKGDANGLPVDATNTDAQVSGAVTASHTRQHAITTAADHTSAATPAQMLKADANGLPIDATNTDAQVSGAVTASHAIQHAVDSAVNHTSTIAQNNLMDADVNGLPDDSGLSVADTSDAITKKHTQNTDVSLKSNATTGVIQITGPAAGTTRVKAIGNANDTIVELGAGGTFTAAVEAADHGAAATDQVINVCYGTGEPPAANTTTIGSLFVQYTA